MRKIIIFWFWFINISYGQELKIQWCSGSTIAKKKLELDLSRFKNLENLNLLKPVLNKWAKEQSISKPIVVIKKGNQMFKWPASNTNEIKAFNRNIGILGTRTVGRPTSEDINCFFQDTIVVVDTLRFFTGRLDKVKFILKIDNVENELPRDVNTSEVLISSTILKNVPTGTYKSFIMLVQENQQIQERSKGILYILSKIEKHSLLEALENRNNEGINCRELFNEAIVLLSEIWGGKNCANSDSYNYTQNNLFKNIFLCN